MVNIYEKIIDAVNNNLTAYLVTIIKSFGETPNTTGAKMLVYENGDIAGTIGGGNIEHLVIARILKEKPAGIVQWEIGLTPEEKMICGGHITILVEPLGNPDKLYIAGGGHCGIALSSLAGNAGFNVTVIDNREEWANHTKHPENVQTVVCNYKHIAEHIDFSKNTYIVIMTHHHQYDLLVLKNLISKPYKYIGMIGSRKKVKETFDELRKAQVSEELLQKVHAPIGIDIHSVTPFEIAVSILAELIKIKNEPPTEY